jgi:ribose transport system substrate-binding protein
MMQSSKRKIGWRAPALPVALVALCLGIAACGSTDDEPTGGTQEGANAAAHVGKSLAIVVPSLDGYSRSMACGAVAEGERLGFEVGEIQAPQKAYDASEQVRVINAVLARSPNGLVFGPANPESSQAAIKPAVADGLKVADIDAELEDNSLYDTFVSSNHEEGGELGAQLLARLVGERGKVLAIGGTPSHPITRGRIDGFEKGIKAYPDIEYVGVRYLEPDVAKVAGEVAGALRANPDITGIYASNATNATGAVAAVRDAGLAGKVQIVTWDLMPDVIKMLRAGDVTGVVVQKPTEMGEIAVQQLANAFDGKAVEKEAHPTLTVATSDDIDTPKVQELYYEADC